MIFESKGSPADASGAFRSGPRAPTEVVTGFFQNSELILFCQIISNVIDPSDQASRCPGQRAGAEDKKGRDQTFPIPSSCFPQSDVAGKGIASQQGLEARFMQKGITAFFGPAKRGTLWAGHRSTLPRGKSSIRRTQKNILYRVFSSPRLRTIPISLKLRIDDRFDRRFSGNHASDCLDRLLNL